MLVGALLSLLLGSVQRPAVLHSLIKTHGLVEFAE